MPLFISLLGESVMKESSPEHSEDVEKIVRTTGDGKKGLESGMSPHFLCTSYTCF